MVEGAVVRIERGRGARMGSTVSWPSRRFSATVDSDAALDLVATPLAQAAVAEGILWPMGWVLAPETL